MKSVGVAVTAIALAISAPAFAAGQTIPLATMTCKQFVDSPKDTIGVILTWMMGYLQDEDEPAELDFSKMEDLGKKLGTYCGQNPTHGVMRALDKVSDADDDSDALKSVVGVWTFGEKQVWIVVRPSFSTNWAYPWRKPSAALTPGTWRTKPTVPSESRGRVPSPSPKGARSRTTRSTPAAYWENRLPNDCLSVSVRT